MIALAFEPQLPRPVELFDKYGAAVYRRCKDLLGDEDAARDAVQAVFLKVVERGTTFRGDSTALSWLFGIATLHCLQQLRDRGRREAKLAAEGAGRTEAVNPSHDARLTVLELLEGEDDGVRQIVFLRHVDGLTVDEISEVVGYSRKTVTRKLQAFAQGARGKLALSTGGDE